MLSCAESAAAPRWIVVDAHGHWLGLRRGLTAARQQRQQRRHAHEHDYDVRFHCHSIIARRVPESCFFRI
jgi:hypothetical protein